MTKAEKRVLAAALRMHYWYMQPIDNDAENGRHFRRAEGDLIAAADVHRRELGMRRPCQRSGLARLTRG